MSRYDIVCENYENVTDSLFGDKTAFADYLKFALGAKYDNIRHKSQSDNGSGFRYLEEV